jgi:hypothetical protein
MKRSVWQRIWDYLAVRKRLWLLPILIMMGLLSGLLLFAGDWGVGAFRYTLF